MWTAHSLLSADPTMRVAILEAADVGFGASGRNGGWCSALFPTSWKRLVAAGGVSGAQAMHQAMIDTVHEVDACVSMKGLMPIGHTVALSC
ncbi:MAG: FAD-dependent oxidoreductase [Marmoricola sp.]